MRVEKIGVFLTIAGLLIFLVPGCGTTLRLHLFHRVSRCMEPSLPEFLI